MGGDPEKAHKSCLLLTKASDNSCQNKRGEWPVINAIKEREIHQALEDCLKEILGMFAFGCSADEFLMPKSWWVVQEKALIF